MKTLCIIPARGGSKRFPKKNTALLAGKPLITYAIETATESGIFEDICVSSDDAEVLKIARDMKVDIVHERSDDLAGDTVQLKTLTKHLLKTFANEGKEYDAFGLIVPVSPLRTADDIKQAYALLQKEDVNTVMSVVSCSHPPQCALCIRDGYATPFFEKDTMKRTQDLETLYRHNGAVVFCRTESFLREGEFHGSKVVPYEMPEDRSANIDEPIDLEWAEFLLSRQR